MKIDEQRVNHDRPLESRATRATSFQPRLIRPKLGSKKIPPTNDPLVDQLQAAKTNDAYRRRQKWWWYVVGFLVAIGLGWFGAKLTKPPVDHEAAIASSKQAQSASLARSSQMSSASQASLDQAQTADQQKTVKQLSGENAKLRKAIAQRTTDRNHAQATMKSAVAQNAKLQKKNQTLQKQATADHKQTDQLHQQLSTAQDKVKKANDSIKSLKQQLSQAESANADEVSSSSNDDNND